MSAEQTRVVIIGNGVAGIEAALAVRARESRWDIAIVSEESEHFFSRPALMYVVAGQLDHASIEPRGRDLYEAHGLRRVRARALGVDVARGEVRLAGGLPPLPYDRLLIASGSRPRPGPWPGSELAGVGHLVTLQDLEWLQNELHGGPHRGGRPPNADGHLDATSPDSPYRPRASRRGARGGPPRAPAVIGGGLVGIEAVEVLHAAGLHPRFLIREEWFWPLALDRRESTWIAERMRAQGVEVHLGESVRRLEGAEHLERIVSDTGSYAADLAVVAIGVVPNTDWLAESELERDGRGGLLVDAHLRVKTRVAGAPIFAAGDCASVAWEDGSRRPEQLWYTARDQGRAAARALLGDLSEYRRGTWYNSAKLFDIEYTSAGLVNEPFPDKREVFFEERGAVRSTTRILLRGEQVVGFNLLGRRWDHSLLVRWIDEGRDLPYVLAHLEEARFDTEFVPPLHLPRDLSPTPSAAAPEAR